MCVIKAALKSESVSNYHPRFLNHNSNSEPPDSSSRKQLIGFHFSQFQRTMKVHPAPTSRIITARYDFGSPPTGTGTAVSCSQKKLRRLPHIFAKVLELPFYSDADVSVQETLDSFKFVIDTDDDIGTGIAAHAIEIIPGVTKIVVGGIPVISNFSIPISELEMKVWRFRLPASTRPELATAAFSDGELVVTVPKGGDLDGN